MTTRSYTDIDSRVSVVETDKIANVSDDTTPQLGGGLDGQGNTISNVELNNYSETVTSVVSVSGDLILDFSQSNIFETILHENITSITILNPPFGGKSGSITLKITQDAVTPRTVTWNGVLWNAGAVPIMTPTVSAVDFYSLMTFNNGLSWYGFVAGQAMA